MTPTSAINHILDGVDGIEIDADNDETVTTLLAAATAIAGVALMRLDEPHERERLLLGIERGVRKYISQVMALQATRVSLPKATNGNGKGNGAGFLGANGAGVP